MRLKTLLAIKADIETLPPRAWNRKDIEIYLSERRAHWNAPKYLTPGLLISFLVENEIARIGEISSKEYGRKTRYVTGNLSVLQFAPTCRMLPRSTCMVLCRREKSSSTMNRAPSKRHLVSAKGASIKRSETSHVALPLSFKRSQPRSLS